MKAYVLSHIGNSRSNQEDNVLIGGFYYDLNMVRTFSSDGVNSYKSIESDIDSNTLLAVSDGMGGHSSGEVASYLTVKYLSDNYERVIGSDRADLVELIARLNRLVSDDAQKDPSYKGMGATLCGFVCRGGALLGMNVGDSRLYRFDKGLLQQLSKDHSEGQRLLDLKLLTPDELKGFPNRKAIYKYIGMKTDLMADVFDIEPCEDGTVLLLCSDGLTDVLADTEIQAILGTDESLKEKGEKLLNTALSRNVGYGDNITIILTEF